MTIESRLGDEQYAYLTTTGRTTGLPREIEIWFVARGNTLYFLSGGGHAAHWVMNLQQEPRVRVRLGDEEFDGRARLIEKGDEEWTIRPLMAAKYEDWQEGRPLSSWARSALPVAVDLRDGA